MGHFANSYDLIGDAHGHADKLRELLARLGYRVEQGAYHHPERRIAIFVGDLIDRGPEQVQVMTIVRKMVDAGTAYCILGNHELNAIGYATPDAAHPGGFLRRHTANNRHHHSEFLAQVREGSAEHASWIAWFRSLPVTLDLGELRAVHAWWHQPYVDYLKQVMPAGSLGEDDMLLQNAFDKTHLTYQALEGLCKGLEIDLPAGFTFADAGGTLRHRSRVRWWDAAATTYGQALMLPGMEHHDSLQCAIPGDLPLGLESDVPLFIGHYWLTGPCCLLAPRIACVDYSAAKDGPLVAYRWDGDPDLSVENFVRSDGSDLSPVPIQPTIRP